METLVQCELAQKRSCRIYWCEHYAEHPIQIAEVKEYGQEIYCTAGNYCVSMKCNVRCKLICEQ